MSYSSTICEADELNESYFGGHRKGRERGAVRKVVVLGLLKRQGKVFTVVEESTKNRKANAYYTTRKMNLDSWFYTGTYVAMMTLM